MYLLLKCVLVYTSFVLAALSVIGSLIAFFAKFGFPSEIITYYLNENQLQSQSNAVARCHAQI